MLPSTRRSPSRRRWGCCWRRGAIARPQSPQEFAAFLKSEGERWGEVIRRADTRPD
ncbi:hypothetical protein [Siccirubricoccus phaeus]|uniref:hypothetical protein n=1 Tax=Siccirubricoccus phaeus TaxID=2595053 RepID=UPI001F15C86C|nr:hypothetical protein [Siccirubricoccus phaeus]